MSLEKSFDLEPNGVNQTKRLTIPEAEEVLFKPIECLDHGFIRLMDYMGGDESIVQAARVSYGKGTKKLSEDEGLIRYLMRHRHTTPFEMVDLKFHASMPIFVARQWVRHRTASINEYSGRYSVLAKEFYVPTASALAEQSKSNRQGREGELTPEQSIKVLQLLTEEAERDYRNYQNLLNEDPESTGKPLDPEKPMIARELARMGLGLNFYTEWYWKANLRNIFHFLGLRQDAHAQHEIRVYADAMASLTERVAPIASKAFRDYELNAVNLSELDIQALQQVYRGVSIEEAAAAITNKRERQEFIQKALRISPKNN